MYEFEYDLLKSQINHDKHGIDFERAQEIWNGFTAELTSSREGEKRQLIVGMIQKKYWTAIITKRDRAIRIISVRRSRSQEIELYERQNRH